MEGTCIESENQRQITVLKKNGDEKKKETFSNQQILPKK